MMKDKLDLVFLDTTEDGKCCYQLAGAANGRLVESGHEKISDALAKHGRYVAVVWQSERVMRDLKKSPFGGRRVVDLYHLAWLVAVASPVELGDSRLDGLARWCGIDSPKDGSLEDRVRTIRECYFRIVTRVELGLKVEGVGREILSDIAEKGMLLLGKMG